MAIQGNLHNRIMERGLRPGDLKMGDGATVSMYSDRHAGTVVAVTPKGVSIQEDAMSGMHGEGYYTTYQKDADGYVHRFRWSEQKGRFISGTHGLIPGRHGFYDRSF